MGAVAHDVLVFKAVIQMVSNRPERGAPFYTLKGRVCSVFPKMKKSWPISDLLKSP